MSVGAWHGPHPRASAQARACLSSRKDKGPDGHATSAGSGGLHDSRPFFSLILGAGSRDAGATGWLLPGPRLDLPMAPSPKSSCGPLCVCASCPLPREDPRVWDQGPQKGPRFSLIASSKTLLQLSPPPRLWLPHPCVQPTADQKCSEQRSVLSTWSLFFLIILSAMQVNSCSHALQWSAVVYDAEMVCDLCA